MDKSDYKNKIKDIFPEFVDDLSKLISYNSKNMPPDGEGAPFGKEIRDVLKSAVSIAREIGMNVYIDPNGYYGFAEIGEGKEMIGILGHLDIVPADDKENWDTDPFHLTEKDGYLVGRGVQDDKGPFLASLYALKLLIDDGIKFKKRIRFIFCTDEESLWRGVKSYMEKEEHPSFGFTPDSTFPLTYAEKGLIEYTLYTDDQIDYPFSGGTALNAVPAKATTGDMPKVLVSNLGEMLDKMGYEYEKTGDSIDVIGKTAHAMRAEDGINAIVRLSLALCETGEKGRMLNFIINKGTDPTGKLIFGDMKDYTGGVSFNIGLADFKKDRQEIGIDIRFPASRTKEEVDTLVRSAARDCNVEIEEYDYLPPVCVDRESNLVKQLMKAYQDVTGDTESAPMTMGGATFARAAENIIAFGASFPDQEVTEHEVNERVKPEYLMTAIEVYMHAFMNLAAEGK